MFATLVNYSTNTVNFFVKIYYVLYNAEVF